MADEWISSILSEAASALRDQSAKRFMAAVDVLGEAVTAGRATWAETAAWAREHASDVVAAQPAFGAWSEDIGKLFYYRTRGEVHTERVAIWRSQLAFAQELFKGTVADEVLVGLVSDEFDQDLREEAERIDIFRPSTYPLSHTWWKRLSTDPPA